MGAILGGMHPMRCFSLFSLGFAVAEQPCIWLGDPSRREQETGEEVKR